MINVRIKLASQFMLNKLFSVICEQFAACPMDTIDNIHNMDKKLLFSLTL